MAVEVFNRQRRFAVDADRLEAVASGALGAVGRKDADVTVTISNDRRLHHLNRTYRGKDRPTDVLSFPYDDDDGPLGDVVISVDRAAAAVGQDEVRRRQAVDQRAFFAQLRIE